MSSLAFYIGIYGLTMAKDHSRLITMDHALYSQKLRVKSQSWSFNLYSATCAFEQKGKMLHAVIK